MRWILDTEHWVIEGAAGVAVAAFLKDGARYRDRNAAVILCGRNLSPGAYRTSHS